MRGRKSHKVVWLRHQHIFGFRVEIVVVGTVTVARALMRNRKAKADPEHAGQGQP